MAVTFDEYGRPSGDDGDPPPPGFVPAGSQAADPPPPGFVPSPSLTNTPVSWGERFGQNFMDAAHGTLVGHLADLMAAKLAPNTVNIDPNTGQPMPTIRQQVVPMLKEEQAQSNLMPSWQDAPTLSGKIAGATAAVGGSLAGGATSPENVLVPGGGAAEGYAAARTAEAFLPTVLRMVAKDAAIQGGTQGVANAGGQLLDTFTGTRDSIDPMEIGKAALMGTGLGAAGPLTGYGIGRIVNALRGGPRVGLTPPGGTPPGGSPPGGAPPGGTPPADVGPENTIVVRPPPAAVEPPPVPAPPDAPPAVEPPPVPPVPEAAPPAEAPPVQEPPAAPPAVEPPPAPAPEAAPVEAAPSESFAGPQVSAEQPEPTPVDFKPAVEQPEPTPVDFKPAEPGTTPDDGRAAAGPEQPQGVPGVGTEDAGPVQPQGEARGAGGERDTGDRAEPAGGGAEGGPAVAQPSDDAEARGAVSASDGGREAPPGEAVSARTPTAESVTVSGESVRPTEIRPEPRPEDTGTPTQETPPVSRDTEAAKVQSPAAEPEAIATKPTAIAKTITTASGKRPVSTEEMADLFAANNKARQALAQAQRKPGTDTTDLEARVKETQAAVTNAEGPPTRPTNAFGGRNVGGDVTKGHEADLEAHTNLVNQRVHAEGQDVVPSPHPQGPAKLMGGRDATIVQGRDSSGQGWTGTGVAMARTGTPAIDRAAAAAGKRSTSTVRSVPEGAIDNVTNGAGHNNPITWDRHVTTPDGQEVVLGTTHAGDPIALRKDAYDTLMHSMGDGGSMATDASKPTKGNTLEGKVVARDANGQVSGVAMPRRMRADEAHTMATGEIKPPEAKAAPVPRKRASAALKDQIVKRETSLSDMEALGAPESKLAAARAQAAKLRDQADMPVQGDLRDLAARAPPRSIPRAPLSQADLAHYSPGASAYRDVFRDAGHDPELASQYPIKRQAEIVRQQVQDKFGFKNVSSDQTSIDTRNMLADFYHNAKSMAAATGIPYSSISLDGRISLTLRKVDKAGTLGTYAPASRTIELLGRSNSFAHEWTHAWDHYLADELRGNPKARALLSETAAIRTMKPPTPGTSNTAEAFAKVLGTIYGKHGEDAAELLRLQYLAGSKDPKVAATAGRELIAKESAFAKGVRDYAGNFGPDAEKYLYRPAEMLARTHEAYVADRIENNGGDTRAVTKPGDAYAAEGPRSLGESFEKIYPKGDDRAHIFEAYDQLHAAQRDESIAAFAGKEGEMPSNADTTAPHTWGALADVKEAGSRPGIFRREINAWKKPIQTMKDRLGFDSSRPEAPPGHGRLDRAADAGRALTYTPRALMEVLIHRVPAGPARDAFQKISDHFAGAEGLRTEQMAAGRHVGQVYEEDVTQHERANINQMVDALRLHGLEKMSNTEADQMHSVMTSGDTTGVPRNIVEAAAKLRTLLDAEHARHQVEANIDLGYSRNAYFPRVLDHYRIFGKPAAFEADATKVYEHVYDRDVQTREQMLDAHKDLGPVYKKAIPPDIQTKIDALRENERAVRALNRERDKLDPSKPQDAARIAAIDREIAGRVPVADGLHDEVEPHIRAAFAAEAANDWANRIVVGDPTEYETRGPASSYTRGRQLPPEADALLRNWYISDPRAAIPEYFRQSARRIAYEKRFGDGKLDALMLAAKQGGAHGEDIRAMKSYVEALTGRQKSGLPEPVVRATNAVMAFGTMSLMTKAAFTSLGEPMSVILRTGSVKGAMNAYANQIGDVFRTASSRERKALANAIGLTTSSLYDSTIAHRMSAAYDDFPGLNKLQMQYFRRSGLTALTNSQRRSMMGAGHVILGEWSRDLNGSNARLRTEAAAQFRDLGIADADHQTLARFMQDKGAELPTVADLKTEGGQLWGQAARRLVNTVIQEPMRVDKPLMSSNPMGRMMFGLMNYNYAFYHHVIERTFNRYAAQFGEAKGVTGKSMVVARSGLNAITAGAGMYGAALVSTLAREALFNRDTWNEQKKQGQLFDWLSDLAIQRTGINGPLDPLVQAINGLRYEKSLTGLTDGAQVGFELHALEKVLTGFVRQSPHTNTSAYNALQGTWEGLLQPAMISALTALPGGPFTGPAASLAMMSVGSKGASNWFARSLVGPKGSTEAEGGKVPKMPAMPQMPKLPKPGAAPAQEVAPPGSMGPWGLVDDVAAPAWRLAQRLPGPLKVLGLGAAAVAGGSALAHEFGRYVNPPSKP